MGVSSEPDLLVLHALKLKGFAEPPVVAEVTAQEETAVAGILTALQEAALVQRREGRISGWSLTPAGRESHGVRVVAELDAAGCRSLVSEAYDRFLEHNESFKVLCTRWQTEDRPPVCIDELCGMHTRVVSLVDDLSSGLDRFGPYRSRFDRAVTRLRNGDLEALTRPLSGSYHDVWMELHEDLMVTLGRKRSAGDGY
jgi:hypothetical protein